MNTHKTLIVGLDDFSSNLIKNHKEDFNCPFLTENNSSISFVIKDNLSTTNIKNNDILITFCDEDSQNIESAIEFAKQINSNKPDESFSICFLQNNISQSVLESLTTFFDTVITTENDTNKPFELIFGKLLSVIGFVTLDNEDVINFLKNNKILHYSCSNYDGIELFKGYPEHIINNNNLFFTATFGIDITPEQYDYVTSCIGAPNNYWAQFYFDGSYSPNSFVVEFLSN